MKGGVSIKDYYRILNISPKASAEEIKKAHHKLAHHYHPDKNEGNQLAINYFLEIQEAYEILSQPKVRAAYDQERNLAGFEKDKAIGLTPQSLLKQAQGLAADVHCMTVHRIDTPWLRNAIIHLLADRNLALLSETGLGPLRQAFIQELLSMLEALPYPYPEEIKRPMDALTALQMESYERWQKHLKEKKKNFQWRRFLPWLTVIITGLLCLAMYFYDQL